MNRGCIRLLVVAAAACVVIAFLVYRFGSGATGAPIHIAVVGPMTGNSAENGRAFVEGARLCIDEVNREGGIEGHRIVLDIHDDQNIPALAAEAARTIAEGGKAVAVIGHNYSSCSIAGGVIYAQKGIPAISPSSTAPSVTIGNDWYFRTIFSDSLEGSFISNYIVRVLGGKRVALIAERGAYGDELSRIFEETGAESGIDVGLRWSFDTSDVSLDAQLATIVQELKASRHGGIVFLAVHAAEGVKLVKLIRDGELENVLVTPNALASGSFSAGFDIYPEEQRNPGYYTNGIFVSSPLLLDSADEDGQKFRQAYQSRYEGRDPDWRAAFSHDAALLIVEGLRATGIVDSDKTITEDRAAIRDWLAGLSSVDVAIKGVTGFNYFDSNGDSQKPVFLGMYSKRNIISTLTQFQEVPNLRSIGNLKQEIQAGRIVVVNGRHMYSTDVVYVGVNILDISDIDLGAQTFNLDFDLWFRFQGDADSSDIVFLNAAEEIDLGDPIDQATVAGLTYLRYRVGGQFKMDFLPADSFERHTVGISFAHRRLTRNNLVYVIDVMGMDLQDGQAYFKQLETSNVLSPASGWRIVEAQLFQDTVERGTQGDPRFLKQGDSGPKFSQFSSKIAIERERLALRRRLSSDTAVSALVLGLLLVFSIVYSSRTTAGARFVQPLVVVNFFAGIAVLIAAEVVIVDGLIETLARYSLEQITRVFDILWWVVPALYLNHALEYFVWRPLEHRADQKIPNIVRRFVAFLIYILTFFAIIAFVYDQKITSLLATSGVIAMIIGLAIQINISNIFSGIALNLERPFKVGDWVRVGSYDEAKVTDMTWRTTRLLLRDNTVLCVPNSIAADSQLVNYHQPDETYELWIYFHVDPSHDPSRVIKITLDALNSHEKVLNDPAPACRFIGYTEWSGEFIAVPMFAGYAKRNVWRGSVMTHLWKELHRAGIRQAVRVQEVHMLKGSKEGLARSSSPIDILRNVEIFRPLSDDAKAFITERMQAQSFAAGEIIVEQGAAGDSLFIIVEGAVGVWVKVASGDTIEVDRMGAGMFFGEMALLTGEARTASIKAVTDTYVFEITRDHIAPLIARQPEMSGILSVELTRRTINRESKKSAHETSNIDEEALFSKFLAKIQSFFGVKSENVG